MIRDRGPEASVDLVKKALVVLASLALVAIFWVGAANAMSATHRDAKGQPQTRSTVVTTEVLGAQHQEQVDTFEVDMHDGGVWEQQPGDSAGG